MSIINWEQFVSSIRPINTTISKLDDQTGREGRAEAPCVAGIACQDAHRHLRLGYLGLAFTCNTVACRQRDDRVLRQIALPAAPNADSSQRLSSNLDAGLDILS